MLMRARPEPYGWRAERREGIYRQGITGTKSQKSGRVPQQLGDCGGFPADRAEARQKVLNWQCIPPSQVEGGDAVRKEVVADDCGDEIVSAHFPIEERAGDSQNRAEHAASAGEVLVEKDYEGTAVNGGGLSGKRRS